jgi:hypothetical protein
MIQKTGNIILALLVLCTTTGLVVNKHFSEGELYSVALYGEADSCCGSEDHHMDSCHNESAVYKVKDYFRTSSAISIQADYTLIIQSLDAIELLPVKTAEDFTSISLLKLLKPKIPKPEFLQVFIL